MQHKKQKRKKKILSSNEWCSLKRAPRLIRWINLTKSFCVLFFVDLLPCFAKAPEFVACAALVILPPRTKCDIREAKADRDGLAETGNPRIPFFFDPKKEHYAFSLSFSSISSRSMSWACAASSNVSI